MTKSFSSKFVTTALLIPLTLGIRSQDSRLWTMAFQVQTQHALSSHPCGYAAHIGMTNMAHGLFKQKNKVIKTKVLLQTQCAFTNPSLQERDIWAKLLFDCLWHMENGSNQVWLLNLFLEHCVNWTHKCVYFCHNKCQVSRKKIRQNWVLNYVKIKRIPVENGRATVKQWQKCTNRIHTHEPNNSGPDPLSVTVCATLLSCSIHKHVSKFTLAGEQTFWLILNTLRRADQPHCNPSQLSPLPILTEKSIQTATYFTWDCVADHRQL